MRFGRVLVPEPSYQAGDDMFSTCANVVDGVLAAIIFNLLGFAGQMYKITLDYAPRGEFLRLSYDGVTHLIAGYPIRSGLGLISGEFFMDSVFDPAQRAAAFYESWAKCVKRGARLPPALLDRLITRNCSITYTDDGGNKHRIVPDLEDVLAPAYLGGAGVTGIPALPIGTIRRLKKMPAGFQGPMEGANGTYYLGFRSKFSRPLYQPPPVAAHRILALTSTADQTAVVRLGLQSTIMPTIARIITRSALTGAYKTADLSNSIARYAEALHRYMKSRTPTAFFIPDLTLSPIIFRPKLTQAWLGALGLLNAQRRDVPLGCSIAIESGGGKTTLLRKYPDVFVDHDDLSHYEHVQRFLEYEDWNSANRYHRSAVVPPDRVLLTWAPDTAPKSHPVILIPLLQSGTGVRMNEANRASLLTMGNLVTHIPDKDGQPDWNLRDQMIFSAIANFNARYPPTQRNAIHPVLASDVIAPEHNYGALAALTQPAGFALLEAMYAAVDHLTPLHHPGEIGKWARLFSTFTDQQRISANTANIIRFMATGLPSEQNLRMKYLRGDMTFLPPASYKHGQDTIVLARDIALSLLESQDASLFSTTHATVLAYVRDVESMALDYYDEIIIPQYASHIKSLD